MANDKTLPDWAVVGAEVLYKGWGEGDLSKRTIDRVTKTSAFLTDGTRFVAKSYTKDFLEEYGSGQLSFRSGRSIQPIAGERAQWMLTRKQRKQDERDFDVLMDAVLKARRSHDPETELAAVTDLIAGSVTRKAQLQVIVDEKLERERQRREDDAEHARLRAQRLAREQ